MPKTFNLLKGVKSYFFETKFKKNNLMHIPKILKKLYKEKQISAKDHILRQQWHIQT